MIRARLFVCLFASSIIAIAAILFLTAAYVLVCFMAWQLFYIPLEHVTGVIRLCCTTGLLIGIAYSFTPEAKTLAEQYCQQKTARKRWKK